MIPPQLRHLWRASVVGAIAVAAFVIVRSLVVPASFTDHGLGTYRAEALHEERAREPYLPSREDCGDCHESVLSSLQETSHGLVHCRHCHGLARHHMRRCAETAGGPRVDTCVGDASGVRDLFNGWDKQRCKYCHIARGGPPPNFPLIDFVRHAQDYGADEPHSDSVCGECHDAHDPGA